MKVTSLALVLGMSIINVSTAAGSEESDAQCTGSNKLHCCKQIQNGDAAAEEICALYNCGLDIQCSNDNNNNNSDVSRILNSDGDGDSWHRWYKPTNSWSKPSGGWNSKVSELYVYRQVFLLLRITKDSHMSCASPSSL